MGVYQDDDRDNDDDEEEDYDDDEEGEEEEEGYDENDRIEKDLFDLLHIDNHNHNNGKDKRTKARLNKPVDIPTGNARLKKQSQRGTNDRGVNDHGANDPSQYVDALLRGFESATAPGLVRPVSANAAVKIRKQQQLQQQRNIHNSHNNQNFHGTTAGTSSNGYNLSERMQQVKVHPKCA